MHDPGQSGTGLSTWTPLDELLRALLMLLLAASCTGCDPDFGPRVHIDSSTAKGMDCAVQAVRPLGEIASHDKSFARVRIGDRHLNVYVEDDGYEVYVSSIGSHMTCAKVQQYAPAMRQVVGAISRQCSGTTPATLRVDLQVRNCDARVTDE